MCPYTILSLYIHVYIGRENLVCPYTILSLYIHVYIGRENLVCPYTILSLHTYVYREGEFSVPLHYFFPIVHVYKKNSKIVSFSTIPKSSLRRVSAQVW